MLYGQYKNVRDAAWRVLIECNITALPVSVSLIANHYGIKLLKNSLVPSQLPQSIEIEACHYPVVQTIIQSPTSLECCIAN